MERKLVPLFDSLTHVTTDGTWFHTDHDASVRRLVREIKRAAPYRACVVGIAGYNMPAEFILDVCAADPDRLVPVAGLDPSGFGSARQAAREMSALRAREFRAVKIHPTLCNVHLDTKSFDWAMDACARAGMPVFLCTVFRGRQYVPAMNPLDLVYRTFVRHSGVKVMFMHSGLSELLSYADLVRALPNSMMDLSFTLMKYAGSSLERDFRYLFENFDRRCVVGSDFPEYSPTQLRRRVAALARSLAPEKIANLCHANLERFLERA